MFVLLFFVSAPVPVEQPKSEPSTVATPSPLLESASSDEFESMVQNIMDMGYDRTQVPN